MAKEVAELKVQAQTHKRSTIRSGIFLPCNFKKISASDDPSLPLFISIMYILMYISDTIFHNNMACASILNVYNMKYKKCCVRLDC